MAQSVKADLMYGRQALGDMATEHTTHFVDAAKMNQLENGSVTTLWLGSSSRAGLAPAACRFIEKFTVPFFYNRPEGARAGGGAGMMGGGLFFCLIGEQGLKHKG